MEKFFKDLEATVGPDAFSFAVRQTANWCNGNLMAISNMRARNTAMLKNQDYTPPTMDTPVGEESDEEIQAAHVREIGLQDQESLRKRGGYFASIREECFKINKERAWAGFDQVRTFEEYIEGRIRGAKNNDVSDAQVKQKAKKLRGQSPEMIKRMAQNANSRSIGIMESRKKDLIAADSDYQTNIDFEEAYDGLGVVQQYRLFTKLCDAFMFEVNRLATVLSGISGDFTELETKYNYFFLSAIKLQEAADKFEKDNQPRISKELDGTGRSLTHIRQEHLDQIRMYQEQMAEEEAEQHA